MKKSPKINQIILSCTLAVGCSLGQTTSSNDWLNYLSTKHPSSKPLAPTLLEEDNQSMNMLDGKEAETKFNLARIQFEENRPEEAAKILLDSLESNYIHVPTLLLLAHYHLESRRFGVAEDLYKLAIQHEPDNLAAHLGIVTIGIAKKDQAKAKFYLSKAKRISSSHPNYKLLRSAYNQTFSKMN